MIIEIKDKNNTEIFDNIVKKLQLENIRFSNYDIADKRYITYSSQEMINIAANDDINLIENNDNYYFISRAFQNKQTIIKVNNWLIGAGSLTYIGGPCAVESVEQLEAITMYIKESKSHFLRGGIFKPRTSPYTFQGLQHQGFEIIKQVKTKYQIPIVCELTSVQQINDYAKDIDIIQIGARNMQNFDLLQAAARTKKPIILKRNFNATINEFLNAAEYIYLAGNPNIILCERGIRSFETAYRNVTDINAIVLLKQLSHLPVFIDPSHATGTSSLVEDVALSAIMAGVDGLLVETHQQPETALSDGAQALNKADYLKLITKASKLKNFMNKELSD
ncbi:3-deoxy-7-phosphoheptulonate synthase [Erysipelotrichaceae bacterium OttesenSCG-928-M19]|nr:3-deoxy-7-phosphoheptulonate synthase [Erysipelotrichaceae bacterium OttesenSCG-928-M19]